MSEQNSPTYLQRFSSPNFLPGLMCSTKKVGDMISPTFLNSDLFTWLHVLGGCRYSGHWPELGRSLAGAMAGLFGHFLYFFSAPAKLRPGSGQAPATFLQNDL